MVNNEMYFGSCLFIVINIAKNVDPFITEALDNVFFIKKLNSMIYKKINFDARYPNKKAKNEHQDI